MLPTFGLKLRETAFWVVYRGRDYGPFDYQWSSDFEGMELHYQDKKFGEYCSNNEIYADLKEFSLPLRVAEVSCLVLGCVIRAVLHALDSDDRIDLILETLTIHGYSKFADVEPYDSEPQQPR